MKILIVENEMYLAQSIANKLIENGYICEIAASPKDAIKRVLSLVRGVGFEINNVDVSVIAERPRLSRYKNEIKINLAKILQIPPYKLCIKATTSEKMGYVGRGEGVAVLSTASLKFFDWTCV